MGLKLDELDREMGSNHQHLSEKIELRFQKLENDFQSTSNSLEGKIKGLSETIELNNKSLSEQISRVSKRVFEIESNRLKAVEDKMQKIEVEAWTRRRTYATIGAIIVSTTTIAASIGALISRIPALF